MEVTGLFRDEVSVVNGVYILHQEESGFENQAQTNQAFSNKWKAYSEEEMSDQEKFFEFQKGWYLTLYGFSSEDELASYLKRKAVIIDAGCGLGYKAKWFADLSPDSLVLGIDYSDAVFVAAERYRESKNLVFLKGDIADTKLKDGCIDYVSCDQVIMHTEEPEKTAAELARVLRRDGELAVYVYARKALPRELLDDYFRLKTKSVSHEEMMAFSRQLTELGKRLSELQVSVEVPDIPLLGIKGGTMDVQRFIYWNFLKCFWNEELGQATSVSTNYDWYSPSNARRYSEEEFKQMLQRCGMEEICFHSEEACHSGRFRKSCAA